VKLQERITKFQTRCEQLEQENLELLGRLSELETKLAQPQPVTLPLGDPPSGQQYGAGMMTVCVNLARQIGLRRSVRALDIVFDWLNVEAQIPTYQTVRTWMQRIGLYRMTNARKTKDSAWLVDHTNQIGKERVLTILRVRRSRLRRMGPLRHQDLEVLAIMPGQEWKRDDVGNVYQETAERYGNPRAIETDGAVELREPAETLGTPKNRPLVVRDTKHFLANQFESLLKQDAEYETFLKKLSGIRPALQQTDLAHFIPPRMKTKARFMNLEPTLAWATAILWHLDHPESDSRRGVEENQMEKLGWIRDFAASIRKWQECQEIISKTLTFINQNGVFRGASKKVQKLLANVAHTPLSRQLIRNTVKFIHKHEEKLRRGERLPMSTEILESSFSLYKQFEQQHSKSGFTGLLLTFPTLLRRTTPKEVTAAFTQVKVADVQQWVKDHLPKTLASKRQLVFRESRSKKLANTRNSATPKQLAA
jgi:hypothetical protein